MIETEDVITVIDEKLEKSAGPSESALSAEEKTLCSQVAVVDAREGR